MSRYKFSTLLAIPALILTGFAFASPSSAAASAPADRAAVLETKMALRDLWVEHVFWIRSYVLATHAHDTAQSKIAEQEVVSNAKALAGTITPFYGQAASDGLFKLLAGHWGAVRDYNTATLAKSKSGSGQGGCEYHEQRARDCQIPEWREPESARRDGVWPALLSRRTSRGADQPGRRPVIFRMKPAPGTRCARHMLVISDAIADALAKQFPARFQDRT